MDIVYEGGRKHIERTSMSARLSFSESVLNALRDTGAVLRKCVLRWVLVDVRNSRENASDMVSARWYEKEKRWGLTPCPP